MPHVTMGPERSRRRRTPPGCLTLLLLALSWPAPGVLSAQVEVRGATIAELQEAMATGRATSADITAAYLARIAAYDRQGPALRAMVWLNPNALADAEALDRERATQGVRGPMHGIPVILKDNYDTVDLPTTAGTLALAGNIAPDDAFQVRKLREAGAVIIGKANMHELASGITTISSMGGQTRNPYDPTRNPGGSSGGTGAAIAASFAAVGWGSDTCGSIRIPAAQNDLVGLRPTKGLSSIDGVIPLSHTQDVAGPLARSLRDLAVALDATIGPDPADPATEILNGRPLPSFVDALDPQALAGARIGVLTEYFGDAPEEAAAARLVRAALGRMVELGADTVTMEIEGLDDLVSGSGLIGHEFKWDLMDYLAANGAPVASLTEILDLGLVHEALVPRMRARDEPEERDSDEYREAFARRDVLRGVVEGAMNRYSVDALVFPTVRTVPAVIGDVQRGSSCSLSANSGLPALSVPVGFTDGLPIGMEIVGRSLADARLVSIGYAFEQATDHRREPTSTPALVDGEAPKPVDLTVQPSRSFGDDEVTTDVSLSGSFSLDPVLGLLRFRFQVLGVADEDVLGVALRYAATGDCDDPGLPCTRWQVAHLLGAPGASTAADTVRLGEVHRAALDAGRMQVVVLTRAHPFGAAFVSLGTPRDPGP